MVINLNYIILLQDWFVKSGCCWTSNTLDKSCSPDEWQVCHVGVSASLWCRGETFSLVQIRCSQFLSKRQIITKQTRYKHWLEVKQSKLNFLLLWKLYLAAVEVHRFCYWTRFFNYQMVILQLDISYITSKFFIELL